MCGALHLLKIHIFFLLRKKRLKGGYPLFIKRDLPVFSFFSLFICAVLLSLCASVEAFEAVSMGEEEERGESGQWKRRYS